MNIALYDADFMNYGLLRPHSYNLMKISAYHKKKRDVVKLITDLSKADLYSKVYYNQDYDDPINPEIVKHDNIEINGYKFSGGSPIILPPEIESCVCDNSIYPLFTHYSINKQQAKAKYLAGSHNTLLSNDEILEVHHNDPVVFHDANIFAVPHWQERILEQIKADNGYLTSFCNKMPQSIQNLADLKFLSQLPCNRYYTYFYTDFIMSDNDFFDYLSTCRGYFCYANKFAINTQEKYTKQELIELELRIMRWNLFSRQHKKEFLLYNKGICENPNLDSFFDLLISWNNTLFRLPIARRKSFYEYIGPVNQYASDKSKYIVRELFNQVVDLKTYAKIDIAKIAREGGTWPL